MSNTGFYPTLNIPVKNRCYIEIQPSDPMLEKWRFTGEDKSNHEDNLVFEMEEGWVVATKELAEKTFNFPLGHPILGHVYAVLPHDDQSYVPFDQYERIVFESKALELSQILIALGATRIRVHQKQGHSVSDKASSEAAFSPKPGSSLIPFNAKAEGAARSTVAESVLIGGEFDPRRPPRLPMGLKWFDSEPLWQAVVDGRLNHRMTKFQFALSHDSTSAGNIELSLRVPWLSAALNVEFEKLESTIWEYEGEFADLDRLNGFAA